MILDNKKYSIKYKYKFKNLSQQIAFLIQEYKKTDGDIRVIVLGGKVVASMKRIATNGSFKSNVHQGGKAVPVNINPSEEKLVLEAAKTLGLSVAGVDFMRSNQGPMILEINSSPGLHAIELSSGVDIASKIISFVEMSNKKISN